jgi:hypothetical protein
MAASKIPGHNEFVTELARARRGQSLITPKAASYFGTIPKLISLFNNAHSGL